MSRGAMEIEREYVRPVHDFRPLPELGPTTCFKTPVLRNIRKLARRYGFTPPADATIRRATAGYYAQLSTPEGTRFWVQIVDIDCEDLGAVILGMVANELPADTPLQYEAGEIIGFRPCNIYRLRPPNRAMMQ